MISSYMAMKYQGGFKVFAVERKVLQIYRNTKIVYYGISQHDANTSDYNVSWAVRWSSG